MKSAVTAVLNRKWMLPIPDAQIHQILLSSSSSPVQGQGPRQPPAPPVLGNICFSNHMNPSFGGGGGEENYIMGRNGGCQSRCFYVVRDDLLHPLVNGNKARKLDALLPLLLHLSVTDVVTCGGCQSAHAAAVAVSCAERGLRPHLLLRGEQPEVVTGYNLVSTLYGDVTYVPRSLYANRESMLMSHADLVAGDAGHVLWCSDIHDASFSNRLDACVSAKDHPTRKVVIVNEGAGDAVALLGFIRLVGYLSQNHLFGKERPVKLVVDAGTGTTAIGLGLGVLCLGLPWKVVAVMLADTIDAYRQKEKDLISNFRTQFDFHLIDQLSNEGDCTLVDWIERPRPRKFGNILEGETETCQRIAQQTGILVDPVYTLATWEVATQLCKQEIKDVQVLMLHTGGTLGMFGLAQRYKSYFRVLKEV